MFPNIERRLGLHQELRIIYVVDGFHAFLENEDNGIRADLIVAEACGASVEEALTNLDAVLKLKGEG